MHIADLHIHSRYSRATSRDCTPETLDLWARRKGIGIVGTGDFTHPAWRQELQEKLRPAGGGLYVLKDEYRIADSGAADILQPHFVITGEISSIYKKYDKVRKVHSLILIPGLEEAEIISRKLEAIGNIHSDGRPILGLDCHDLLEILLELCPEAVYVPAHIWTPHFSLFGAFSGFNSVEECFGDLSSHIHAMETGLSSDPPMNWRVSALDRYQLISNSDAHSPAKLGREASLLDIPLSYEALKNAIETGNGLAGTIEFFPEEGKYHFDGHRKCDICLSPSETEKYGGICPVCGRRLTIGVSHRIEQMADRSEGYIKRGAPAYESLVPLPEIIAASVGYSSASAKVQREYQVMLKKLGPEFPILREIPLEEIRSVSGILISEGIGRLRQGTVTRIPGFDGRYGIIRLFTPEDLDQLNGQLSLFSGEEALPGNPSADSNPKQNADSVHKSENRPSGQPQNNSTSVLPTEDQQAEQPYPLQSGTENLRSGNRKPLSHSLANERQRCAIEAIGRVTVVTAGPGTGKTYTLVSHILHLLEIRRVKPSCITAVTFTNQAAEEMRERIQKQIGKSTATRRLQIGTFHSIAWKFLMENGVEASLAGETVTRDLAESIIKTLGLNISVTRFLNEFSRYKTRTFLYSSEETSGLTDCSTAQQQPLMPDMDAMGIMSDTAKDNGAEDADERLSADKLAGAFATYQNALQEYHVMDFDDILIEACRIASDKPAENKTDAGHFTYLMVDEFQDISPLEYRLMKAWNEGGKELFVIGDADQSIYGFRGSDARCFERLAEEFPKAVRVTLEENYRSTPQILTFAEEIISKNPGGTRHLQPHRPDGLPVRLVQADSAASEAIFIAKEINRLTGGIGMLDAQDIFPDNGGSPKSFDDIAVLYRTRRQADLLETCLKKEGIPYIVSGRDDYLLEPAVRGTISFFTSLLNPASEHRLAKENALKLLWNSGTEGPADRMADTIYEAMAIKYTPFMKKKKPVKILEEWTEELSFGKNKAMQKLCRTALFYPSMADFIHALEFGVESDLKRCGTKQYKSGTVTLMTLHGSKGLEFPAVLIFGARGGIIPFEYGNGYSDVEEERRLFYVGITRARENLILTTSKDESAFLTDVPEELLAKEKVRQAGNDGNYKQMSLFDFTR